MKVQQRHIKAVPTKKTNKSKASSAFQNLFAMQQDMQYAPAPNVDETTTQATEHKQHHPDQPLSHILHELEDLMLTLEENSKDYTRAQMAIHSLRDALRDMPDAFPLTAADREEAKALLVVESKRIDELQKYNS